MSAVLTCCVFWLLVAFGASSPTQRALWQRKTRQDWVVELQGLAVQGALIPMLMVGAVAGLARHLWPHLAGIVSLPPWAAFALNFVGVDYLYYWNHRFFHTARLWPLHLVHHAAPVMDVFCTSRNAVWTSFFIVYVWCNGIAVFLLEDPSYYLVGATVTAMLDLWRHSSLTLHSVPQLQRVLGSLLVLPEDHAWHHGADAEPGNYAANLVLWDKLHGTWLGRRPPVAQVGAPCPLPLRHQLFWPFAAHPNQE